jgi:hypothetical protein
MAIMLTASVFAVARNNQRVRPDASFGTIEIMKTFDLYRVICDSDICCQKGKCLGTVDADTCLSLCALLFDTENTEYWVYTDPEMEDELVGYCINGGICEPVCVCQTSEDGRVRYTFYIKTKNPGTAPSLLTSATLCLAAEANVNGVIYVGSDYEQPHIDEPGTEATGVTKLILPDPDYPDSGQNVILCPMCPTGQE